AKNFFVLGHHGSVSLFGSTPRSIPEKINAPHLFPKLPPLIEEGFVFTQCGPSPAKDLSHAVKASIFACLGRRKVRFEDKVDPALKEMPWSAYRPGIVETLERIVVFVWTGILYCLCISDRQQVSRDQIWIH
ncbi:unnamed protein product, partial [Tilletia caries]